MDLIMWLATAQQFRKWGNGSIHVDRKLWSMRILSTIETKSCHLEACSWGRKIGSFWWEREKEMHQCPIDIHDLYSERKVNQSERRSWLYQSILNWRFLNSDSLIKMWGSARKHISRLESMTREKFIDWHLVNDIKRTKLSNWVFPWATSLSLFN